MPRNLIQYDCDICGEHENVEFEDMHKCNSYKAFKRRVRRTTANNPELSGITFVIDTILPYAVDSIKIG